MLTQRAPRHRALHAQRRDAPRRRRGDPRPGPDRDPRRRHPPRGDRPVRGRRRRPRPTSSRPEPIDVRQPGADRAGAREAAREPSRPSTTTTPRTAIAIAAEQARAFDERVAPVDTAFAADLTPEERSAPARDGGPRPVRRARRRRCQARRRHAGRRSGPRPRRVLDDDPARRAARHRRRRDPDASWPAGWPVTSTRRSGCSPAELDRAAGRPQLVVRPGTLTDQARDRPPQPPSSPCRVESRQGEIVVRNGEPLDGRRHRDDPGARPRRGRPPTSPSLAGWFLLALPDRGHAAGLDLAVPPDALAPQQRAGPHRPAARRDDAGAQGHGRPRDPRLLPADRGHRDAARDPARRVGRDGRHGGHRDHRRRLERQLARVRGVHLPRRARPGIIAVRKGDRLQVFVQAAIAVFVVNVAGRVGLLAARGARHPRRARAVVRVGRRRRSGRRSRPSGRSPCSARCSGS